MKEVLIPVGGSFLVCGLFWHPLSKETATKDIRAAAGASVSKLFAQIGVPGKGKAFFAVVNEHEASRKRIHALAVALAKHATDRAVAVILKYDEFYAACCINRSIPVIDKVFTSEDDAVREIEIIAHRLGITPRINFKHKGNFEYEELLGAKLLGPKKGRVKSIQEVPQSPIKYIVMSAVLLGAGYLYLEHKQEQERLAEEARQQAIREADPVPKYMKNLMLSQGRFALPDSAVFKMLGKLGPVPQRPAGWAFEEAICSVKEYQCSLKFRREDGVFTELQKALAGFKLRFQAPTNLNEAIAVAQFEPEEFQFPSYDKDYARFISEDYGDIGQTWLTASLGIAEKNITLWPETPGVPSTFKHPMAVMKGEIAVGSIPLDLFGDFMRTKPRNMHLTAFKIKTTKVENELVSTVDADTVFHVKQTQN
ncbi:type 4b pilus protein PilO2 [Comamonas sp. w2-DMI]|uniref:type 4b pilus protein PilO2 n=1 Tax=Comamonas sp. w2-DMI TaxID=3126391 RepID=UPI0032E50030